MAFRFAFLLLISSYALSIVYTPKILINKQTDYSSLESIIKSIVKPEMTDQQKADTVWRFIMKSVFHYKPAIEGPNIFEIYTMQDPLKTLNCYGYTYCFASVGITTTLWKTAGFDTVRFWGLPGHLVSEVFYGNAWHYYDADQSVSAYFCSRLNEGTVASVEEIRTNPSLYILTKPYCSTPNMPYHEDPVYEHESRDVLVSMFSKKDKHNTRDFVALNTHSMDFFLKKYESLTLFFSPQGKWRHNGMDVSKIDPRNGPFDAHGDRKYGNGLFEYFPDFRDTTILSNDLYSYDNVQLKDGKLVPKDTSKYSEIVIKTLSPYIITGTPLSPSIDYIPENQKYTNAVLLNGHIRSNDTLMSGALNLDIQISTDKMGGDFKSVYTQLVNGYFNLDLSDYFCDPVYFYYLKIRFKKNDACTFVPFIDSLRLKTWVQVNPVSLPHLEPGNNEISYFSNERIVDKHESVRLIDTNSIDSIAISTNNGKYLKSYLRRIVQDSLHKPATIYFVISSAHGPIVDYAVSSIMRKRENMKNDVYVSEGDTLNWKNCNIPEKKYMDHWKNPITLKGKPAKPVTKIYFKVVLDGGAAICTFDYNYRVASKNPLGKINVTQGYTSDGKPMEHNWSFNSDKGKTSVKIKGKKISNTYIKYSVVK